MINGTFAFFLIGITLGVLNPTLVEPLSALDKPENRIWGPMVGLLFAIPMTALFIGLTGTSIGKWIFGIKVLNFEGAPIGIGQAFMRELYVFLRGLALGLPFFSLIALFLAYRRLANERITSWDQDLNTRVVHRPVTVQQKALYVFGILLILVLIVFLTSLN
jgi:uncharacterized RDD family membrane protein YckC